MIHTERIKKTRSGVKWTLLGQVINQSTNILFAILLTRLLSPSVFGLLGMVLVFSGFLQVIKDFGISNALIYKKDISDLDLSTAFWSQVTFGFVLSFILLASKGLIADFYNEPNLEIIIFYISFVFIIDSLGYVHSAYLKKKLLFKSIFLIETTGLVISGLIALLLALNSFGVWSLVIKLISLSIIRVILLWLIVKWKPSFIFSKIIFKEQLNYGLPLVGNKTTGYFMRNGDNLLIGKFIGADALGIYNRAYSLMMLPVSQITNIFSSVMFPSFSLINDNNELLRQNWIKLTRLTVFIILPITSLIFLLAEPFVVIVLGTKWIAIISVLQALSFSAAVQPISANGFIFNAKGKTKELFIISLVINSLLLAAIILGIPNGINTVALYYAVASLLFVPLPRWYFTSRLLGGSLFDVIKKIKKIMLASLIAFFVVFYIDFSIDFFLWFKLLFFPIIYFLSYSLLLFLFNEKIYLELYALMKTKQH